MEPIDLQVVRPRDQPRYPPFRKRRSTRREEEDSDNDSDAHGRSKSERSDKEIYDYSKPMDFSGEGISLSSTLLLGSPTPYYQGEGRHVRNLTIRKDESFSVQACTITEGPMKGFQALVLVPMGYFRFLDMPAELRHAVYELLLGGEGTTLRFTRRPDIKADDDHYRLRAIVVGDEYQPRKNDWKWPRVWNGRLQKFTDPNCTVMNLLLTSKQFYSEVFEVLYRTHIFEFNCAYAVSTFFALNPASAKYITRISLRRHHVEYLGSGNSDHGEICIKDALKALVKAQATAIRTIEFRHYEFRRDDLNHGRRGSSFRFDHKYDAGVLVNECIPLLNIVYRARQRKGVMKDVDEVLKVNHSRCQGQRRYGSGSSEYTEADCQQVDEEVKNLVREGFMLDE